MSPTRPSAWSLVLPALAVGGLVWSVIPFGLWWADASADTYTGPWRTWAWGAVVVTGVTGVLLLAAGHRAAGVLLRGWRLSAARVPDRAWVLLAGAALAAAAVATCLLLFSGNARNVDGFAQLFQARIFLAGRLWVEPPRALANFATLHMVLGPDRWFSQYPPGQPALLAVGLAAGAWWVLNPLWCFALVAATYRVARWATDRTTARLTAALFVLSPFLVAVSGSELNHLPAAALGMIAAACATTLGGRRWAVGAAGVGAALGLLTAFRPLDAVAAAVPAAFVALATSRMRVRAFALIALAGALATLPTLWFNHGTTGAWTEFGYNRLWGPGVSLGFHPVPWGTALTPQRAVGLTGLDLHQLDMYLFDLPVPALIIVAAGYVVGRRRLTQGDALPWVGTVALMGLLFFYWHRDTFYGPRLLFGATPWLVLLFARAMVLLHRASATIGRPRLRDAALVWVSVALVVGLATVAPSRLAAYRASTPMLDLHPDRAAKVAGIHHAVVLIPDGWGSRLIARMWGDGVPVPRSTRLYAAIDACTLEQALDGAEAEGLDPAALTARLDSLARLGRPGVRAGVTDDPNLRLPADGLVYLDCRDELVFDRQGFLAFTPFLYLNAPTLDGDIVWARDLRDRNGALRQRYPDRGFYRYAPTEPGASPTLTRLDRAPGD